jgi:small subunit ribosomal protein S20
VAEHKAAHNQTIRSAVRSARRRGLAAAEAKSADADASVKAAASAIDRAARKHILHPNKAARQKSQLMKALNAAKKA